MASRILHVHGYLACLSSSLLASSSYHRFLYTSGSSFAMDLFSFLDDGPAEDNFDSVEDANEPSTSNDTRKRRADSSERPDQDDDVAMDEQSAESGPPAYKKPRKSSPQPVVVDEFETEAKREVAASAGLTGTVEAGSRLELRHQVRCNDCLPAV